MRCAKRGSKVSIVATDANADFKVHHAGAKTNLRGGGAGIYRENEDVAFLWGQVLSKQAVGETGSGSFRAVSRRDSIFRTRFCGDAATASVGDAIRAIVCGTISISHAKTAEEIRPPGLNRGFKTRLNTGNAAAILVDVFWRVRAETADKVRGGTVVSRNRGVRRNAGFCVVGAGHFKIRKNRLNRRQVGRRGRFCWSLCQPKSIEC